MRRSCTGRIFKLGVLFVLLLVLLTLVTHRGQVALKSAGLLVEVFPSSPIYPLRLATDAPTVTKTRYPGPNGEVTADLYRPAGEGPFGAMVLYIGIGPETRNANVVRLAEGLARTGVAVLVPVSPELSRFRVVPEEKEWVIAAFEYLSTRPYVEADQVGIMGVSAGGSLVAVAAQDARIRDEVRLLELFGSYYSAASLLEASTVQSVEVDGVRQEWQPDEVPFEVFRDMILPTLPPRDRPALAPLFDGKQTNPPPGLSPEGAKVAAMLLNRDPDRVSELLAALPAETRALLVGISPETRIEDLKTELFLLHDRDDNIIPFTESRAFAAGAVNARAVHLTELRLFRHVEPQAGGDPVRLVQESVKLYLHVYEVLLRLV
ncbi:MAG: prolyl oligopeptidase family serine peptidase [Chloroflexota bacterium]|nr:prolyl oligopeptidase family serine peptidase [Chloroflexota bacterium]